MTTIKSELLLASKNRANGITLYTFRLTYPRVILAECLTHRNFSRNTSSTRAIPTLKAIKAVWRDMFVPTHIGGYQKGMQAGTELTGFKRKVVVALWKSAGYTACVFAYLLFRLGVAKQISGRLIEPFSWVTQIMSTTDINNFFKLRNHAMAEPHLHELAAQMQKQVEITESLFKTMHGKRQAQEPNGMTPNCMQWLNPGEWHLPMLNTGEEVYGYEARMVSAARCARTSYTLLGSSYSEIKADIALCNKLMLAGHFSPFEHQAEAVASEKYVGNFRGFIQYRKWLKDEAGEQN